MNTMKSYPPYTLITYSPHFDNPIPLNILQAQIEEGLFDSTDKTFRVASILSCGLDGTSMINAYISKVSPVMYAGWENDFLSYVTDEDKAELAAIFQRILQRGAPTTTLVDACEFPTDFLYSKNTPVSSPNFPLPYEEIPQDTAPSSYDFTDCEPPPETSNYYDAPSLFDAVPSDVASPEPPPPISNQNAGKKVDYTTFGLFE